VTVTIDGSTVTVKGPKGTLTRTFDPRIKISLIEDQIIVERTSEEKEVRALHGTTRALIQNMVTGVSEGFSVTLKIRGVGYRAELKGKDLQMSLGSRIPWLSRALKVYSFKCLLLTQWLLVALTNSW